MTPDRLRREFVRLSHRGLGVRELSLTAATILRRAVPFEGVCVLTFDPASLLPTGEVIENGLPPEVVPRLTEIEIGLPDYNKFTALSHAASPVASLSAATGGRLDDSLRQRELRRPSGFEDELRAVLRSDSQVWGALTLLRERGRPHFTDAEVRQVATLTAPLAEGLRRSLLLGELANNPGGELGVVILTDDNRIEFANPAAGELLAELSPPGTVDQNQLPIVVQGVADRTRELATSSAIADSTVPANAASSDRNAAEADRPGLVARSRVRTRANRWLVLRGSLLGTDAVARVAVIIEPAKAPELAPLIAAAYGLTTRERTVTQHVANGYATGEIAARMHVSTWTVQDHLKAIFAKTGTGTRGELVARLFFDHYAPRLDDTAQKIPPGDPHPLVARAQEID